MEKSVHELYFLFRFSLRSRTQEEDSNFSAFIFGSRPRTPERKIALSENRLLFFTASRTSHAPVMDSSFCPDVIVLQRLGRVFGSVETNKC
jgi:hypothetical protein